MWLLVFVWFDFNNNAYNESMFIEGTKAHCEAGGKAAAQYLQQSGQASEVVFQCQAIEDVEVVSP